MTVLRTGLIAALLAAAVFSGIVTGMQDAPGYQERDFLTRVRRLTVEGKRAGEGYWSPDGKRLVFQSEREAGNPVLPDLSCSIWSTGDTKRISPGIGKTTCAFFRPGSDEIAVRLDPRRSEIEAVPGRGAGVPRVRQGAPLLVGLRPGDGHLRLQTRRPAR